MYFIYILQCRGGGLYTGIAKEPEKRFLIMRAGKAVLTPEVTNPSALCIPSGKERNPPPSSARQKLSAGIAMLKSALSTLKFNLEIPL